MIDTTHFKRTGGGKSVSNTVYLNDDFSELFEGSESSSIIFIHLNKKDAKADWLASQKTSIKIN